eukprot:TRINITY_DN12361_c0_g2_i1.p1 TRINITY_DN12361_c0_g2~~TRINITY_DN12361_c0_g2_i1.p1  ORF type:complete len:916 (-),score=249.96 TRINITY_DN12361_c0_g2_i1:40-2766(-)
MSSQTRSVGSSAGAPTRSQSSPACHGRGSGAEPHEAIGVSPQGRSLAGDLRRIASSLQDAADADAHTPVVTPSSSSSRPMADQHHRRHAAGSAAGTALAHQHLRDLVSAVSQIQGQREADRRKLAQMERRLELQLEERLKGSDGRERWAETQGNVQGLLEDMQAMRQRLEALDARLWARTGGSEGNSTEQRLGELSQQLQALEHQSRLASSTMEETQRRQVAKIRRTEQSLEELLERVSAVEQDSQGALGSWRQKHDGQEDRLRKLEQQQDFFDSVIRNLKGQVERSLQAADRAAESADAAAAAAQEAKGAREVNGDDAEDVQARRVTERNLVALEKKTSAQIQDLSTAVASLRVKADGQLQRLKSLAERMETAHEPGINSLRGELAMARSQDQQRLETELAALRTSFQELADGSEESSAGFMEALRKVHTELAAFRPMRSRLAELEAELGEVSQQAAMLSAQAAHPSAGMLYHAQADKEPRPPAARHLAALPYGGPPDLRITAEPCAASGRSFQGDGLSSPGSQINQAGDCSSPSSSGPERGAEELRMYGPADPEDSALESSWEAQQEQEQCRRDDEETAVELQRVAGFLEAADALADRVTELERLVSEQGVQALPSPRGLDFSGASVPGTGLAGQLFRVSQEVVELQARLLQFQLCLHTGQPLDRKADVVDANGGHAPTCGYGTADAERELRQLAEQVRELGEAVGHELGADPGGATVEATSDGQFCGDTMDNEEILDSPLSLLVLADRLEPLELAFRQLVERLGVLSADAGLPSAEADSNGQGDDQLAHPQNKAENGMQSQLQWLRQKAEAGELDFKAAAWKIWSSQEKALASLRADLDQLQELQGLKAQAATTAGPSLLDPSTAATLEHWTHLAVCRGKLDHLNEQMAELHSRMREGQGAQDGQ